MHDTRLDPTRHRAEKFESEGELILSRLGKSACRNLLAAERKLGRLEGGACLGTACADAELGYGTSLSEMAV